MNETYPAGSRGKLVKVTYSSAAFSVGSKVQLHDLNMRYYGTAVHEACKKYNDTTGVIVATRPTRFKPYGIKLDKNGLLIWLDSKEVTKI